MSYNSKTIHCAGFTLIEVITTIVVLSVAATAIMSMFTNTITSSANPMIQQQAISVAEAYMEEILLKSFDDPDGIGGETRANFDDVLDYNGLTDVGARDQNNSPIASLGDYTVSVTVTNSALNGIVSADSLRIRVSVDHTVLDPVVIDSFRTNY